MSWFGVLMLTIVGLVVAFQLSIYWRSKRMIGQTAPRLEGHPEADDGDSNLLIYFHSPNCGPCKRMSPMIDEMAQRYPNVHSIDISQSMEIALKYNVRATPTTILVEHGKVAKVMLGPQSPAKLEALLN